MAFCAVTCLDDWHDPTCPNVHEDEYRETNPEGPVTAWTGDDGLTRFRCTESTQTILRLVQ